MMPSRRRVLKALQALPLQALHLAYAKPVHLRRMTSACLGQRPPILGVVVSSTAGLIIAVRVEVIARRVPSQAGNATSEGFDTLLYGCYIYQ